MPNNKQEERPQFSQRITDMCKMIDDAQKDYTWNQSEVNRMDKLTQDYLHMLELDNLDYKERAKVATQLSKCRQLRRGHKDTVETLEPLVQYIDGDKGKNLTNLLKEVLGKTRKAEERMERRVYFPRILTPEEKSGVLGIQ